MSEHWSHSWGVLGHDWAVNALRESLRNRRARHAYLIAGPDGVGKETLARGFAMALNCMHPDAALHPCGECSSCVRILSGNHPDILYSQTDATTGALKVEEVRGLSGRLSLKPYEGHSRIAIVRDFDRAAPIAQDALLKTLEEPPPYAVLLLVAEQLERVLPTIISRSQLIHLRPVDAGTIERVLTSVYGADPVHARLLAGLSGGRIGWAIRALADPDMLEGRTGALDQLEALIAAPRVGRFAAAEPLSKDKPALIAQLELWQTWWRDALLLTERADVPLANVDREQSLAEVTRYLSPEDVLKALQATRETIRLLNTTNANTRLALEVMLLDYPGLR
ncbi:MAG: DNA polymerase III subunit [Pleurocapsa minor GSE-CHR-MK-17-07R]|jgi:DNA polymerase-3 subunit delta'|nr:DNA polymerase III subunit [Pleurocapsa minor GSE-CHR-MK 17-07R]